MLLHRTELSYGMLRLRIMSGAAGLVLVLALAGCAEGASGHAAAVRQSNSPAPSNTNRTETPTGNRWWVTTRPAASDNRVEMMVHEDACASGQPATGRIRPDIEYEADRIIVTVKVENAGGDQECPGNPDTSYRLELEEAIGDRAIYDGQTSPPTRAQKTYFS
jgi:hypothetical protein